MDALVIACFRNTNVIMILAWILWERRFLKHERYYDFGMDALVIVCFRNTNVSMILAWMFW